MNHRSFKVNYEAKKVLQKQYAAAVAEGNESRMEEIRKMDTDLQDKIKAMGEAYRTVYPLYCDRCDRDNDYIDIFHIREQEVRDVIKAFRKYGIKIFTFSSLFDAANISWAFIQNGCRVTGMTRINGVCQKPGSNEYEKVPAYIFVVE